MAAVDSAAVLISHDLLEPDEVDALIAVWHDFGSYRPSSAPRAPVAGTGTGAGSAPGAPKRTFPSKLQGRFDASRNFIASGGRFGRRHEGPAALRRRTDYFRETFASGTSISAPGAGFLMRHSALCDQSRALYGLQVVVPVTVYANVLTPARSWVCTPTSLNSASDPGRSCLPG